MDLMGRWIVLAIRLFLNELPHVRDYNEMRGNFLRMRIMEQFPLHLVLSSKVIPLSPLEEIRVCVDGAVAVAQKTIALT